MEKQQLIILFSLIVLPIFGCNNLGHVEYRPHYLNSTGDVQHYGEPILDSVEQQHIIQVLRYYGETYKLREDGIVLITRTLNNDWELVWNYTIKSNDEGWLKTHIPR